jgi:antirestriction protein ArdC
MKSAETTATETARRDIDWQQLIDVALNTRGSVGNVYNRFYEYSFLNQMLLRMQGVSEPVATYKRWQSLGRQVLRGSKAHAIVRPIIAKRTNDEGLDESKVLGFKPVNCLFAVSQTSGEPLPPVELPGWELNTALRRLDIRQTSYELLDGNTQGYSLGREFAINPVAVDPVRTTFHEIGHIVLGHTAVTTEAVADGAMHRGEQEFQAEATAYLTLNELEQITPESASHSRGYIQHWLGSERPSDLAIRQVFSATDTILKAGRPSND